MQNPHHLVPSAWAREIACGLIAGAVALAYALSYAALLFPGALRHLIPIGVGLALVNAAIGCIWLSWRSQMPFALAGPDGNTTSILAAMAAALAGTAAATGDATQVLVLILGTTVLCALVFLALGIGRLGSAVRFVPYPVIGGFLASTGWLIAIGGVRVVADLPPATEGIESLMILLRNPQVLVTIGLSLLYLVLFRRYKHPAVMPAVLLATAVSLLVALYLTGFDEEQARATGWLFDIGTTAQWTPAWRLGDGAIRWSLIAGQWLDMLAVVTVGVITLLLGSSGLEVMSRRDISFDRELREHGWMNLAAAALGGYLSIISVGRSAVLLQTGARTRLAGQVAGGFCLLAMVAAPLLLGWLPKTVLAAFLLYLGLSLLHDWVIRSRDRLGLADWSLVIVILATTATIGFTLAVLAGILASCLNFALSYSRLGVVQHDLDGTGIRSSVQRPAKHRELLTRHGPSIRVLVLRGVIFFGTASTLLDRVRGFLKEKRGDIERELVLDFSHVDSADSSAALTFTKIAQLAASNQVRLVVCGLGPGTRAAMADAGATAIVRPTLDLALDEAEEGLLLSQGLDPQVPDESLGEWLGRELGGPQHWEALEPLLQRRALRSGEMLMAQGDESDESVYLIERGRLAVRLPTHGEGQRLASLMSGTIVGEMALYDQAPRSANVVAERKSVVWGLSRGAVEHLHTTAPDTAMQVHAFIMRTMAERVRQANAAISALQRGA
ncbi:cyclic nucleotide-binding domain-containing protein [Caenimonas sedimenti]|uniref:Cyclic nucleotide-binding domain-containing protein n=1 Tax=Caenimonas sedimenti TaxID=2596921 RepID=A0A562ZU17_9BURK|nr:SulP family inorganic anion transporter [Caenimonas sedimenti]TWO71856.1 cyclic nucleotide-binding domain-containing protein [Caenimonas sedimenti]